MLKLHTLTKTVREPYVEVLHLFQFTIIPFQILAIKVSFRLQSAFDSIFNLCFSPKSLFQYYFHDVFRINQHLPYFVN